MDAVGDLMVVPAHSPEGRMAWWLTLDGDVVLVAARLASPSTAARQGLTALRLIHGLAQLRPGD